MSDDGPDFTRLIVRFTLAKEALISFVTFFNVLENRVTDRRRGNDDEWRKAGVNRNREYVARGQSVY